MNCKAYSSFEGVSSNHRIISVKIHPSLQRKKTQTVKASQYDKSSLTNSDIRNQYKVTPRNKFDTLQEISKRLTLDDECENFVTVHIEAAAEYMTNQEPNVDFHGCQ